MDRAAWADDLALRFALPPVSFHQHPAAMAMDPAMRDPTGAGMRRMVPAAGSPHVVGPVPAVVAADPYKPGLRRRTWMLDHGHRRSNLNVYLRKRGRGQQRDSKQHRQYK